LGDLRTIIFEAAIERTPARLLGNAFSVAAPARQLLLPIAA
jgi:hypothetical protein